MNTATGDGRPGYAQRPHVTGSAFWRTMFGEKLCGARIEGTHVMAARTRRAAGRADPFGLLVLVVLFALSVTIGIQIQVLETVDSRPLIPVTVFAADAPAARGVNG